MYTKRAPANSLLKIIVDLLQPKSFDKKPQIAEFRAWRTRRLRKLEVSALGVIYVHHLCFTLISGRDDSSYELLLSHHNRLDLSEP